MNPQVNDPGAPDFSILIPAFNEGAAISMVLSGLCAEPALDGAEIIVVDDGSSDDTAAQVAKFARVRLLRHRANQGYGSAIVTGARAATGRFVLWFDADGQHRVEDLVSVAHTLLEKDLDYCVGVRDKASVQERTRLIGKAFLRLAVSLSASQPIHDFNSGLRGFRRSVLLRYLHILPKGFGASTTMSLVMVERGYYGEEVPILVRARVGKSSMKLLRDGWRTLTIVMRILLLFKPMRFFGNLGILFFLTGLIYGLVRAFLSRLGIPVLASLVMMLGVQSFFFGLLCDQISQARLERLE